MTYDVRVDVISEMESDRESAARANTAAYASAPLSKASLRLRAR